MRKNIREFFEKMQEFFPSTKNAYIESVEEYGEVLETVNRRYFYAGAFNIIS